jgi:hypothetical protein
MGAPQVEVRRLFDSDPGVEIDAYRLWLRLAGPRLELRAGLQQIDFGPAVLLRSLMWFDRIDPRDPLRRTGGVWGLLGRVYFLNNANIWLWALAGNESRRGWELLPPDPGTPEFGGRFQYPLGPGEAAASLHWRRAELAGLRPVAEQRLGLDGRFDLELGLWFEAALVRQDWEGGPFRYRRFWTAGADYTLAVGNGLHALVEQMQVAWGRRPFATADDGAFSAVMLDYGLGVFDRLRAVFHYDWKEERLFRFLSWVRTYDSWNLYINGFWNPAGIPGFRGEASVGQGKGIQLMVVFNHALEMGNDG